MATREISGSRATGSAMNPAKPMAVGGKISQHTPVIDKGPNGEPPNAAALRKATGRK